MKGQKPEHQSPLYGALNQELIALFRILLPQLHRDSPDGALIPGPVGLGFAPSAETAALPTQHQLAGMAAANGVNISQGILDWALLKSAVRLAPQCQAPSIASSRPWPHQYKTWTQTVRLDFMCESCTQVPVGWSQLQSS